MVNPEMIPTTPLGGMVETIGDVTIAELADLALVSIATPLGGEKKMAAAIKKAHSIAMPAPGQSVTDGAARLINMGPGQLFAVFPSDEPLPSKAVAKALGDAGYYVDQTDAWVVLRVSGQTSRAALERICPIDLDPDIFAIDAASRTVMEHMTATVIREADDSYLLMSASSSAKSFAHAIVQSAKNIS